MVSEPGSPSVIGSTSDFKNFIFSKILSIASSKASRKPKIPWILDSSTTYHITPITGFSTTDHSSDSNRKFQTANGTLLTGAGINTIILDHVLHYREARTRAPCSKTFNKLSVQKIASLIP